MGIWKGGTLGKYVPKVVCNAHTVQGYSPTCVRVSPNTQLPAMC